MLFLARPTGENSFLFIFIRIFIHFSLLSLRAFLLPLFNLVSGYPAHLYIYIYSNTRRVEDECEAGNFFKALSDSISLLFYYYIHYNIEGTRRGDKETEFDEVTRV